MSWRHFHFNCRFLSKQLELGNSKQQALVKLHQFDASALFKKSQLTGYPKQLFDEIVNIANDEDFKKSLESYNNLNLSKLCLNEDAINNQSSNLSYITSLFVIYLMVAFCFKLFVFPTFVEMFALFKGELPVQFLAFDSVFLLSTPVMIILLGFAFYLQHKIKLLPSLLISSSPIKLWIFPKQLQSLIRQLNQIIRAPLSINQETNNNPLLDSINEMENQGLLLKDQIADFSNELRAEFDVELNKFSKRFFVFLQSCINALAGFLIIVMYLPIFSIGHLI